MDGRCQEAVAQFGREKFHADYPDTITEAGIVGTLAHKPSDEFLQALKQKILISLEKHHSKGIVVDGHAECAGNPVDDEHHKEHIEKSIAIIKTLVRPHVVVVGVFVHRCPQNEKKWEVEELL